MINEFFFGFFSVSLVKMIRNNPLDFQNRENWFLVHSRWLKLGYGTKIGQKWAKNGYFQNFKNYRYCLKETWKVLYWAKIPAQSKKLDTKCLEPFGGKSGGWVLLQLIVILCTYTLHIHVCSVNCKYVIVYNRL